MKPSLHNAQILRDISRNPGISQREIALKNGISLGKVNYAIKALMGKGYIRIQNFNGSRNKRKYLYQLTPAGVYEKANLAYDFLKCKMEEYDRIKKEIEELEADVNGIGQESKETKQQETVYRT